MRYPTWAGDPAAALASPCLHPDSIGAAAILATRALQGTEARSRAQGRDVGRQYNRGIRQHWLVRLIY